MTDKPALGVIEQNPWNPVCGPFCGFVCLPGMTSPRRAFQPAFKIGWPDRNALFDLYFSAWIG